LVFSSTRKEAIVRKKPILLLTGKNSPSVDLASRFHPIQAHPKVVPMSDYKIVDSQDSPAMTEFQKLGHSVVHRALDRD
jgi:hypothetical protein